MATEVNGVWWPPSSSKRVGRVIPVRWVRFLPPPPTTYAGTTSTGMPLTAWLFDSGS